MAKEWHFLASEEKCFVTQESLVSPLCLGEFIAVSVFDIEPKELLLSWRGC